MAAATYVLVGVPGKGSFGTETGHGKPISSVAAAFYFGTGSTWRIKAWKNAQSEMVVCGRLSELSSFATSERHELINKHCITDLGKW